MNALHQAGGVPSGWRLTPPAGDVAAGRRPSLISDVRRATGSMASRSRRSPEPVGPDLTGMGAHHPPGYFAEAIMNPDAVLIEGPGYIGPDGHSVMPDYPEVTVQQLGDMVAYLASLKTGGAHAGHVMPMQAVLPSNIVERPPPPEATAKAYFIQTYDVSPANWRRFKRGGRARGPSAFSPSMAS